MNSKQIGNVNLENEYVILSITSEIVEDNYEDGESMTSTGCGLNENIGKVFLNMKEIFKYLASNYGLTENPIHYDVDEHTIQSSKQVADHCDAQNGGWFEPTENEIKLWKEGKFKLYTENFFIDYRRVI